MRIFRDIKKRSSAFKADFLASLVVSATLGIRYLIAFLHENDPIYAQEIIGPLLLVINIINFGYFYSGTAPGKLYFTATLVYLAALSSLFLWSIGSGPPYLVGFAGFCWICSARYATRTFITLLIILFVAQICLIFLSYYDFIPLGFNNSIFLDFHDQFLAWVWIPLSCALITLLVSNMVRLHTKAIENIALKNMAIATLGQKQAIYLLGAGIIHDLSNAFHVLSLNNNCLLQNMGDSKTIEAEEQRDILHDNACQLQELIKLRDALLELCSDGGIAQEILNLDSALREILPILKKSFPSIIEWSVDRCPEATTIFINYTQLSQIFINLTKNAVEAFENKNNKLKISIAYNPISISSSKDETTGAIIYFKDNGPGIPDSIKGNIFDYAFSDKNSEHASAGFGIGLASVKTILEIAGGSIELCDTITPGGACFCIKLPPIVINKIAAA